MKEAELLVGLQQQLQGRQAPGILIDDQLQVVAGAVPLAGLGVDGAFDGGFTLAQPDVPIGGRIAFK